MLFVELYLIPTTNTKQDLLVTNINLIFNTGVLIKISSKYFSK